MILLLSGAMHEAPAQAVKVVGHRGASSLAPENTLASFRKAIELGVDYLELDVWNSYDDSLMVIHDLTIDRTTNGTGQVLALTYTQLRRYSAGSWFAPEFAGERIPTLREVLTLAQQYNAKVCIEIKNTNITSNVVQLVDDMGMSNNAIICCFYLDALIEARKLHPGMFVLYYVDAASEPAIDTLKSIGGSVIGSGGGNTQGMIDYAHQKGIEFWPWTIDAPADMITFIGRNVDAIITNYPQVLLAIVDSLSSGVADGDRQIPGHYLIGAYPNPFNPTTNIRYTVAESAPVTIRVYNDLGQPVTTLMENHIQPAGTYTLPWNAAGMPSGIYFITLQSANHFVTAKGLLLR